jgi:hypothetical protein
MEFMQDIGRTRLPDVDAMLAFQLEFYLRAFVAGRPFAWSSFDAPGGHARDVAAHRDVVGTMLDGRPHRDVVALFVRAAFPDSALVDARAVAERMKDLTPRVLWLDDFQ